MMPACLVALLNRMSSIDVGCCCCCCLALAFCRSAIKRFIAFNRSRKTSTDSDDKSKSMMQIDDEKTSYEWHIVRSFRVIEIELGALTIVDAALRCHYWDICVFDFAFSSSQFFTRFTISSILFRILTSKSALKFITPYMLISRTHNIFSPLQMCACPTPSYPDGSQLGETTNNRFLLSL